MTLSYKHRKKTFQPHKPMLLGTVHTALAAMAFCYDCKWWQQKPGALGEFGVCTELHNRAKYGKAKRTHSTSGCDQHEEVLHD